MRSHHAELLINQSVSFSSSSRALMMVVRKRSQFDFGQRSSQTETTVYSTVQDVSHALLYFKFFLFSFYLLTINLNNVGRVGTSYNQDLYIVRIG